MLRRILHNSRKLTTRSITRYFSSEQLPQDDIETSEPLDEIHHKKILDSTEELGEIDPKLDLLDPEPDHESILSDDEIPEVLDPFSYASIFESKNKDIQALYQAFDSSQDQQDKREAMKEISSGLSISPERDWMDFFSSSENSDIPMNIDLSWEILSQISHYNMTAPFLVEKYWTGTINYIKKCYVSFRVSGKLKDKSRYTDEGIKKVMKANKSLVDCLILLYMYFQQEGIHAKRALSHKNLNRYIMKNLHEIVE